MHLEDTMSSNLSGKCFYFQIVVGEQTARLLVWTRQVGIAATKWQPSASRNKGFGTLSHQATRKWQICTEIGHLCQINTQVNAGDLFAWSSTYCDEFRTFLEYSVNRVCRSVCWAVSCLHTDAHLTAVRKSKHERRKRKRFSKELQIFIFQGTHKLFFQESQILQKQSSGVMNRSLSQVSR